LSNVLKLLGNPKKSTILDIRIYLHVEILNNELLNYGENELFSKLLAMFYYASVPEV